MHIIVNLQPLLSPLTGIGYYTRELTRELLHHDTLSVQGVTGRKLETLSQEHPLLQATQVAGQPVTERDQWAWQLARRYLRNPLTRKMYRWLCAQRLRYNIEHPEAIYWEPNYVLLPWKGRSVVTVHDLSHQRYPEHHPAERVQFLNRHLASSLFRATRINVVSQFTANELQELHGVAPERIDIVPPAVAERFFSRPPTPPIYAATTSYRRAICSASARWNHGKTWPPC